MKNFLNRVLLTCGLATTVFGTMTNSAEAAFFFDFENPLPDTVISAGVLPTGDAVPFMPSIETLGSNSFLRLSDDLSASEGGFATSFFANQAEIFEDVRVSALLNPTGDSNDQVAVSARGNLATFDAYFASIDFSENRAILSKSVGGEVTVLADAFDILPTLDTSYFVELEVVGNNLTGRFFDSTGENELFSLSAIDTDNPLVSGVSGLAVDISETAFPAFDDPNNSTFDNFSSSSIPVPEPSVLFGFLGVSAIAMGNRLYRKVSRR